MSHLRHAFTEKGFKKKKKAGGRRKTNKDDVTRFSRRTPTDISFVPLPPPPHLATSDPRLVRSTGLWVTTFSAVGDRELCPPSIRHAATQSHHLKGNKKVRSPSKNTNRNKRTNKHNSAAALPTTLTLALLLVCSPAPSSLAVVLAPTPPSFPSSASSSPPSIAYPQT